MHKNLILDNAELRSKLEDLCSAMLGSGEIEQYNKQIQQFEQDQTARELFDRVADWEEELHNRQHNGEDITDSDIDKLEELQQQMLENELCREFLEVQDAIQEMMLTVEQYLAAALELGRIPTKDEVGERLDELAQDGLA